MSFKRLVEQTLEEEEWILFLIYDYKTYEHKYKYSKLSELSGKWKRVLNSLKEDNSHHKGGTKKDKQMRSFDQESIYAKKGIFPTKHINALISTKEILDETIDSVKQDAPERVGALGRGGSMTELIELDKYNVDQEVKDAWKGIVDEL